MVQRLQKKGIPAGPVLILVVILLAPGCTTLPVSDHPMGSPSPAPPASATPASVALYKVAIPQEAGSHADYLRMDTDVYNQGEVVEFYVVNGGSGPLKCGSSPYVYTVEYRRDDGSWNTVPEPVETVEATITYLKPGQATAVRRFVTANWTPGLYRIAYDCGISREFVIRLVPQLVPANASG